MTSRKNSRNKRSMASSNHEGSWAVSYVDMLTLLLCFFIVFFNSDKTKVNNSLRSLEQIRAEIGGKGQAACQGDGSGTECKGSSSAALSGSASANRAPAAEKGMAAALSRGFGTSFGNGSGPGVGEGDKAGTHSGEGKPGVGAGTTGGVASGSNMKSIFKEFSNQKNLLANSGFKDDMLEIEFAKVSFFESGSKTLTKEGQQTIENVMKVLAPYKDHVRITVQGHTDSTSVVHTKNASDNWELSVIRATSVLKLFKSAGFPQSQLSAEGFADTKPERDIASNSKEDLAKQRRITLRVEELKP